MIIIAVVKVTAEPAAVVAMMAILITITVVAAKAKVIIFSSAVIDVPKLAL